MIEKVKVVIWFVLLMLEDYVMIGIWWYVKLLNFIGLWIVY